MRTRLAIEAHARCMPVVVEPPIASLAYGATDNDALSCLLTGFFVGENRCSVLKDQINNIITAIVYRSWD